ncbi:hypothetical protein TOPH_09076 [Tolypocladium ophioglossoides CBS 100239]|uniref:Uncharacterized protein n=1 Tax=Tolypocladium ophioglossoides (strain CBS 100239) TaxID=1163406 RepID=A0A0L0MWK3_TOLOC|nr:hypothetical protein TOPH_09076 [Tolypocladium ophioglossoides CBS 100239]
MTPQPTIPANTVVSCLEYPCLSVGIEELLRSSDDTNEAGSDRYLGTKNDDALSIQAMPEVTCPADAAAIPASLECYKSDESDIAMCDEEQRADQRSIPGGRPLPILLRDILNLYWRGFLAGCGALS